jgi:hypothetical protein
MRCPRCVLCLVLALHVPCPGRMPVVFTALQPCRTCGICGSSTSRGSQIHQDVQTGGRGREFKSLTPPSILQSTACTCGDYCGHMSKLALQMHTDARNVETCLGTALDAAFNIMQHIGGKMVVCQTSLPSLGKGKLRHRYMCAHLLRVFTAFVLYSSFRMYLHLRACGFPGRTQRCLALTRSTHFLLPMLAMMPSTTSTRQWTSHGSR